MVCGQQNTDTEDMDLVEKDTVIREEAEDDLAQYDSSVPLFKSLRHLIEVSEARSLKFQCL